MMTIKIFVHILVIAAQSISASNITIWDDYPGISSTSVSRMAIYNRVKPLGILSHEDDTDHGLKNGR